jgi:hypothetical protein
VGACPRRYKLAPVCAKLSTFPFGDSISPVTGHGNEEWIRQGCASSTGTVETLIPTSFEAVVRLLAPAPGMHQWWSAYREMFVALGSTCAGYSSSQSKLTFGIWEGHGFQSESNREELSRIPRLAMPNRNYLLLTGDFLSLGDLRYPSSDEWRNPDLVWPDDHAWFIGTDVDFWSLYVGGSMEMIHEIESQFGGSCRRVNFSDKLVVEN